MNKQKQNTVFSVTVVVYQSFSITEFFFFKCPCECFILTNRVDWTLNISNNSFECDALESIRSLLLLIPVSVIRYQNVMRYRRLR